MTNFTLITLISLAIMTFIMYKSIVKSKAKLDAKLANSDKTTVRITYTLITVIILTVLLAVYGLPAFIMNFGWDIAYVDGVSYVLIFNATTTVIGLAIDGFIKRFSTRTITIDKSSMSATINTNFTFKK